MQLIKETDDETWTALKDGDFMVTKSGIPFTNLFVDQTLEQLIRELKVAGGITGITQNESALNRFFLIAPELLTIINQFQDEYCIDNTDLTTREHYQLTGTIAVRLFTNSAIVKEGIIKHCGGNPFLCKEMKLMSIDSNMLVPESAKKDILNRDEKGANKFAEFVTERVVQSTAKKSLWDQMKKLNLKTFSTCRKKTTIKVGNKLIKLREDRQLLARFLVVQQSRPSLIQSLGDAIGRYEFSVIPRSLFSTGGLLLIPQNKSAFMKAIVEYRKPDTDADEVVDNVTSESIDGETRVDNTASTIADAENVIVAVSTIKEKHNDVCIIDAMAIVQGIKKHPSMKTCCDFAREFIRKVGNIICKYKEGRVIFDRYIMDSLKAQTREKRSAGVEVVKFDIKDTTNIRLVPLKTFLSHVETKSQLTQYLGKALLTAYKDSTTSLIVVYGNSTYSNKPDLYDPNIGDHSHEEADTLIPMHVLDASKPSANIEARDIDVYSPDTDVLLLLMDLVSNHDIFGQLHLITGKNKGKPKDVIDIREKCVEVGFEKSRGLLGLHAFTGADWGGKFASVTKARWIENYLKLESTCDAVTSFQTLGEEDFSVDTATSVLEKFVCAVYSKSSKCRTVKDLRWELFKSKNLEAEHLPPTLGSLIPHIQRAHMMSLVSKGYKEPRPHIPPLIGSGWVEVSPGIVAPMKCLQLPAPQAVIDLAKCGCKCKCESNKCSCKKNDLPCTDLCKCSDCGNIPDYKLTSEADSDV